MSRLSQRRVDATLAAIAKLGMVAKVTLRAGEVEIVASPIEMPDDPKPSSWDEAIAEKEKQVFGRCSRG